jgi:two-component system, sensor histidine kinase and response regulator
MPGVRGLVLVVDDIQMNRLLLCRQLEQAGYQVAQAGSGQEALELVGQRPAEGKRERGGFDLVLLDVMMPGMSGTEVLVELRRHFTPADLPVIMVTARDQTDDVVESLRLGANDYVTKPVDFAVLLARVGTQLRLRRLAEEKDEFLAIASHDLKNPLTVIMGCADLALMLMSRGASSPEIPEMLQTIRKRAGGMQRTIEDYLDFQAMEDGRLTLGRSPSELGPIVAETIAGQLGYAREKGVEVVAEPEPALPAATFDPSRIAQVVENLVGNAIKFGRRGTRVRVTARAEGGALLVEVTDSGPGLTEKDLRRLFVKYARLSNKPTGGEKSSGLGLVICKRIVEAHGGEIGARNNEGEGATFWFRLPVAS